MWLGFFLILCLSIAFLWPVVYCLENSIWMPPPEVNGCQISINNSTREIAPIMSYGVSIITGIVGMVALLISFLGVFVTMLVITVGNYRQQFYDTLWKCLGNSEYVDEEILNNIDTRHKILNRNADKLNLAFKWSVRIMLIELLICAVIITIQKFIFDNMWFYIWLLASIFILVLVCTTTWICLTVLNTVSYPDMKKIQEAIGDKIILKLQNDLKKGDGKA